MILCKIALRGDADCRKINNRLLGPTNSGKIDHGKKKREVGNKGQILIIFLFQTKQLNVGSVYLHHCQKPTLQSDRIFRT